MPGLNVITNIDEANSWRDIHEKRDKVLHLTDPKIGIARVPEGMESGASSVMIRIDLPNGTIIMAETTMALFLACADVFKAKEAGK